MTVFQITEVQEEVQDAFDGFDASSTLVRVLLIGAIVVFAILASLSARVGLRFLLRRAVRRASEGVGRWTVRLPRPYDGKQAQQRRLQRADAAAFMLGRIATLLIVILAGLAITRVLDIDPVVLVSSAGFIGAGIAIGGQTLIKDWIVGLIILLDDRYAVGDQVTMRIGANDVTGSVEALNGAGVRLRLEDGTTWHAGHGTVEAVINHSQSLVQNEVQVPADVWAQLDETMVGPALNAASHDLGLTDVVLLPELQAQPAEGGGPAVTVLASRKLTDRQLGVVRRHIERCQQPVGSSSEGGS